VGACERVTAQGGKDRRMYAFRNVLNLNKSTLAYGLPFVMKDGSIPFLPFSLPSLSSPSYTPSRQGPQIDLLAPPFSHQFIQLLRLYVSLSNVSLI